MNRPSENEMAAKVAADVELHRPVSTMAIGQDTAKASRPMTILDKLEQQRDMLIAQASDISVLILQIKRTPDFQQIYESVGRFVGPPWAEAGTMRKW